LRSRPAPLSRHRPIASAGFYLPYLPIRSAETSRFEFCGRLAGYEDSFQLEKERVNLRATD